MTEEKDIDALINETEELLNECRKNATVDPSEEEFVKKLVSRYLPILIKNAKDFEMNKPHYGLEAFWPTILSDFERLKKAKDITTLQGIMASIMKYYLERSRDFLVKEHIFQLNFWNDLNKKYGYAGNKGQPTRKAIDEYNKMKDELNKPHDGLFNIREYFNKMEREMYKFKKGKYGYIEL